MERQNQRRGVINALGLRRRPRFVNPGGPQQPVQQPPVRPIQPPPVQPVQQPPVQPVQPGWQAAPRQQPQNQPRVVTARENAAAQKRFEAALKNQMPLIQRAKQFALTVDGKRIELARLDAQAPVVSDLQALSSSLQTDVKMIDSRSSAVRKAAEANDYVTAEREFSEGLKVAQQMLGQDTAFQAILKHYNLDAVDKLAGDEEPISDAGRDFRRMLKNARPDIEKLLEINSLNSTIARKLAALEKSFDICLVFDEEEKFDLAQNSLDAALESAKVVAFLQPAWLAFEEKRQQIDPLIVQLRTIKPTDNAAATHKLAIS